MNIKVSEDGSSVEITFESEEQAREAFNQLARWFRYGDELAEAQALLEQEVDQ